MARLLRPHAAPARRPQWIGTRPISRRARTSRHLLPLPDSVVLIDVDYSAKRSACGRFGAAHLQSVHFSSSVSRWPSAPHGAGGHLISCNSAKRRKYAAATECRLSVGAATGKSAGPHAASAGRPPGMAHDLHCNSPSSRPNRFLKKSLVDAMQGENRFESGAYTAVREHFEPIFNAAARRQRPFQ
jgi:hypothetical protein